MSPESRLHMVDFKKTATTTLGTLAPITSYSNFTCVGIPVVSASLPATKV